MLPSLLTLTEAAEALRCSRSTLERRIRDGLLPVVRDGGRVLIEEGDLRAYIASRKRAATGAPTGTGSPAGVVLRPGERLWD